jgi:hypothetical protein
LLTRTLQISFSCQFFSFDSFRHISSHDPSSPRCCTLGPFLSLSSVLKMAWFYALSLVVAYLVSSAAGASFQVQVGENGTLTFNPQTINAQPDDTVTYFFHPKVSFTPHLSSIESQLTFAESFRHPIVFPRSVSSSCRRVLLRIRSYSRPYCRFAHDMDNYGERYQANLGVLCPDN